MTQNTNTNQTSQTQLYEFLINNGFYIERPLADLIEKVILTSSRKAFLLRGSAGVGKTQLTYLVAQWLQATYIFYQCTYGSSEDDLLYKYIPSDTKSGIKLSLGPVPRALAESKNRKVVLVFDEFDKTRPSADALLLDVLQNFRVALYIDDNETIVAGNPENLVVFITSNDMREFSEPLLRRVISITLQPLPTAKVFEILSKRFKKEIALLLTQIYDDTVKAGLRKPATIQELYQLGEVLEVGTGIPLDDLLRMFIIKYDDDWQKFVQYVSTRKLFQFFEQQKREEEVAKYYEPQEQEIEIRQSEQEHQESTSQLLQKLASIIVKRPQRLPEVREEINGDREATFKAKITEEDVTMYTAIVKKLMPEPSETGDVMGKFRVVKSDNEISIISEKPLTIDEYLKLAKDSEASFEAYIEDRVVIINPVTINMLIEVADNVYYYSNKLIRVEKWEDGITELVEVALPSSTYSPMAEGQVAEAVIRAYAKVEQITSGSRAIPLLAMFTLDSLCKIRAGDAEMSVEAIAQLVDMCIERGKNPDIAVRADTEKAKKIMSIMEKIAEKRGLKLGAFDEWGSLERKRRLNIYISDSTIRFLVPW
jgi:MoxR-like ATPase